jgi:hypothetical protein
MAGIRAVAWIWPVNAGGYRHNFCEQRITLMPRAGGVTARD